jgi:CHAT domain-containing protein
MNTPRCWRRLFYGLLAGLLLSWTSLHSVSPSAPAVTAPTAIAQSPSSAPDPITPLQQSQQLYNQGRFAEAAVTLTPTIAQFAAQGATLHQASALSNLSLIHQQLGNWDAATEAIAQSLVLLHALPDSTPGKTSVLAQSYLIQGRLHHTQGNSETALEVWMTAGNLFQQIADTRGWVDSQLNQAQALQSLGFYQRATQTLRRLQTTLAAEPDSLTKAIVLRSLGDTLRIAGNLSDAQTVLEQSLAIAQPFHHAATIADIQLSLGNTVRAIALEQKRLGEAALRQSEREQAQIAFQRGLNEAIALYTTASDSPQIETQVQAQLNHLSIQINQQNWAIATELNPQIQAQLDQQPPSRTAIYNRIAFAEHLMQMAREAPAIHRTSLPEPSTLLAIALQQARALNDARAESFALGSLGALYEQHQQWQAAQSLTEQALFLAQQIYAQDIAYRWNWQLGRVLKMQGQEEQAIAAYQDAVQILEMLRGDLVATNRDIQFSFRDRVEPVYRQLVSLLLNTDHPSQESLSTARTVIEGLQLAELDNFFRSACLDTQPVQIDQIDRAAAVIYPILLDQRLAVILSLPDQPLQEFSTPVSRQAVESVVGELVRTLRIPPDSRGHLPVAQQLYDWLVRPLEETLTRSGVETLVFVPDSVLQNVPMAALHDGEQYLIQQYSVALTPGLQLLETRPLSSQRLSMLKAGLSEARGGFSPLPGVEEEISQLQSLIPQGDVLLNQDFTSDRFESTVAALPAPIVHLATHGQFSSQLEETFILTWDGRMNVGELSQILRTTSQDQENPIDLLVLSACQTAVGDRRAALGLAGMAVGAGARSTMATLWQVDDAATVALINAFYAQIAVEGTTKAEALQRAQQSLINDPVYRRPYFWSAFVLVGSWL